MSSYIPFTSSNNDYSSLIRRSFIESVDPTSWNLIKETEKLCYVTHLYKEKQIIDRNKYQIIDGEVRIKPSLTLTLSNNTTRVLFFDSPEGRERFMQQVDRAKDNQFIKIP